MKKVVLSLIISLFISSCGVQYAIKKNYDFTKIKRIAVVDFSSQSAFRNSGDVVADEFVFQLLKADFEVIERNKVSLILKEKGIAQLNESDPDTIRSIGKVLGVDAIITGSVSKYLEDKKDTLYITNSQGNITSQIFLTRAEVDVSSRMIDVFTGEIVWSAKNSYEGLDIQDAVSGAVSGIVDSLSKLMK